MRQVSPLVSSRKTINRWVFPGVSESDPMKNRGGDEKLSDEFGASARTANQRRRGHLEDFWMCHQAPNGVTKKDNLIPNFGDLWLQLHRNFAFFASDMFFFLQGGRVVVARVRRGFSEWFGTSGWHLWIWNLHPGSVARRLLFGHYRFGVKDSAIIEWLWLDAPPVKSWEQCFSTMNHYDKFQCNLFFWIFILGSDD